MSLQQALITGGTGTLGTHLRKILPPERLRILSRRSRPEHLSGSVEWAQGDLLNPSDIEVALSGVDLVIHLATSPGPGARKVDVEGTRNLIRSTEKAGISHLVFQSIVGIDRIPFSYYQKKLEAEQIIQQSEVPHSILRATQFHELIDTVFSVAMYLPYFTWLPTAFKVQSIAASEVAEHLHKLALAAPAGRVPDIGGPEVRSAGEMARRWMEARDRKRKVFRLPIPGQTARAFREGRNTCPDRSFGKITWEEWLTADTRQDA